MPDSFDEFCTVISYICGHVVSTSNGMGSSYLYQSAKDVLKWNNLSVKDHIKTVMSIGQLVHLNDEQFEEVKNSSEFLEVDAEALRKLYDK